MRPADAPPVPKGKVRQLYPPPAFEAESVSPTEVEVDAFDEPSSLFISDAEELEERRLRARERAEARRRSGSEATADGVPPEADRPEARPVDDGPGSDEWPVF
jgi:hypothetical protein